MVEVARLESVYRLIAYRGFESPSLRQEFKSLKLNDFLRKAASVSGRLFLFWGNLGINLSNCSSLF